MKFLFSVLFTLSVAYSTPAESAYVKGRLSTDQVAKINLDIGKIAKMAEQPTAKVAADEKARTGFQQQEVACYQNGIVENFASAKGAAITTGQVANFDENNYYVYSENYNAEPMKTIGSAAFFRRMNIKIPAKNNIAILQSQFIAG